MGNANILSVACRRFGRSMQPVWLHTAVGILDRFLAMRWIVPLVLLAASPLAARTQPAATATQVEQALAMRGRGDLAGAQAIYASILTSQPSNQDARTGEVELCEQIALQARARGENTQALRMLLQGEALVPNNARLLYDAGVLEDNMQLYWDADASVSRLQALPEGAAPNVLYLAARVKMDLGQLALAAQDMRAYLQVKPGDATAHYGLGRVLKLQERFDQARAEFERSLALEPRQTESQFELGEIALAQGRYQDAIGEYAKTLAGNPEHGGALAGTGIALFHLKQFAQAEPWLRKAIAAAPNYEPAHYYLGLTLARMGRKTEAQTELAQATRMEQAQSQEASQRLHLLQTPSSSTATITHTEGPQ
jgi:tetratricopeptide (TPR) repeat protein